MTGGSLDSNTPVSTPVPVPYHIRPADRLSRLRERGHYYTWRRTIPFTDAQILDALDHVVGLLEQTNVVMARRTRETRAWFAREHHLTERLLAFLLPFLVQTCGLCGEIATHRYGCEGRCAFHKDDMPPQAMEQRLRMQALADRKAMERYERDQHAKRKLRVRGHVGAR